jgi:hypothetical protein
MTVHTLVMKAGVTGLELISPIDRAGEVVNGQIRSGFHYVGQEPSAPTLDEYSWLDFVKDLGKIKLIEDRATPVVYIQVLLLSATATKLWMDALMELVPYRPIADLQADAEHAGTNRDGALTRLALGETREHDSRTQQILSHALSSSSLDERRAAIEGIYLLRWSAFVPYLRGASGRESDERMRHAIDLAIATCQGANPPG